jgi:hypothetical protein
MSFDHLEEFMATDLWQVAKDYSPTLLRLCQEQRQQGRNAVRKP